eukprot:Gb_37653 [translate_table: standard]
MTSPGIQPRDIRNGNVPVAGKSDSELRFARLFQILVDVLFMSLPSLRSRRGVLFGRAKPSCPVAPSCCWCHCNWVGLIDKGYSGKGLSLISVLGQAESPVRPEDRSHIYRMDYLSHPLSLSVEYLKVLLFLARSMSRQPVGTKSRIIKTCGTAREVIDQKPLQCGQSLLLRWLGQAIAPE